jgi:N-acetyltransferase 10
VYVCVCVCVLLQTVTESHGDIGKVMVRVNVFKEHRQTIQYILPTDHVKLAQAELVAIDEAAAIPLPVVKKLLGNYLVFMSSTINGYEGTGRALSLKLIQQLRIQQGNAVAAAANAAGHAVAGSSRGSKKGEKKLHEERWKVAAEAAASYASAAASAPRVLTELALNVPIRYAAGDPVEQWLNNLLCMDIMRYSSHITSGLPAPRDCELYLVNRDALFSYHAMAEGLLQRIWALYTSAHYKNSPNDLQMLSDAPAHRLFVLLGPNASNTASTANTASSGGGGGGGKGGIALPDILCVLQVAFEGQISQQTIQSELMKGSGASGDLIPWTISQQFNDSEFGGLSGARIVRIATHPGTQKK